VNKLYYGDCLTIMRDMPLGSVDLVYLDPPFNSNREYSAIYKDETGRPLPDQIEAFNDSWELSEERQRAIRMMPILMRDYGIPDEIVEFWRIWMNALRNTQPKLLAYLSYMTERLLPLKGIVKPTGAVFLHCDPTASHYIKVMMDGIFGHQNFRSEIIWRRMNPTGRGTRRLANNADHIIYYAMGNSFTWHRQFLLHDERYVERNYRFVDKSGRRYRFDNLQGAGVRTGSSGAPWRGVDPNDSGSHWAIPNAALPESAKNLSSQAKLEILDEMGRIYWPPKGKVPAYKRYLDEMPGTPVDTIWDDIGGLQSQSKERLGYATQKPVALLERIISMSSNEGELVFDPFCGCATTLEAAQRLGRRWIGIDIAIHAIKRVAKVRLEDRLGLKEGVDFTVEGVPHSLEGAHDLWERDKYHFQKWAIEQVDGFVTSRKSADGGIDGRLYFSMPNERDLQSMVIEVKGGKNINPTVLRDLRGVLERDQALMAGLIVMEDLGERKTKNFRREMGDARDINVNGVLYPRMQMLSVPEILTGKRFLTPSVARGRTVAQPSLPFG